MKKTVTVYSNKQECPIRIKLPEPIWVGCERSGVKEWIEAIYISPKSKRMIIRIHSEHSNSNCEAYGTIYRLIEDEQEMTRFTQFPGVAEALDQSGLCQPQPL